MNEKKSQIMTEFVKAGWKLTDLQAEQFVRYFELLVEWNEKMNLTAITNFDEVVIKHFIDSATGSLICDFSAVDNVLDLGTGAGFPGVPLKILYPDTEFVLMDSLNKRITFLQEVIDQLGLQKITAVHGRAEEMARNTLYREKFDVCTSRAVANTSTLLEYCMPFVKVHGCFVAYKSGKFQEEITGAKKSLYLLQTELESEKNFMLADTDMERTLVVFRKNGKTSMKYPRKAGMPSKQPLG